MGNRVLCTGASGLLGDAFLREVMRGSEEAWTFTVHRTEMGYEGPWREVRVDLREQSNVEALLRKERPDAVIHLAALADPGSCEKDPELSKVLNLDLPLALAQACRGAKIPLVHFSTDLVFDGQAAPYVESDAPRAISVYAEHKIAAETAVLDLHPDALVARLPLLFGASGAWTRNGWRGMLDKASKGEALHLFTDEFRTPIRTDRIASFIPSILGKASGLLHLGGSQSLSRHEMGVALLESAGLQTSVIVPGRQSDREWVPARPPNVSLNSKAAQELGLVSLSFREECESIVASGGWLKGPAPL